MRISFVTDSTADLPAALARQYGIEVVPALVNIGGKSYADGIDISREEFYRLLPTLKSPPTTSAPSVGSFQKVYEQLFARGAEIVLSIHAASRLSGIFNAARVAAQEFGRRVRVLDSEQLSLGLGFQVLAGAETACQEGILDEVLAAIERVRQRVRVIALLDSPEYVRRSGRVSWAKAALGTLLRIQPLVELRFGQVQRLGQARTRAQGLAQLKEALLSWGPLERLAVLHTNAETAARQLLEEVRTRAPAPPLLVNVTTAIGTHVGPNALGLAAVPLSW